MKRFKDLVREGVDPDTPDSPSMAAATYKQKPNKEPMPKLKEEHLEEGRPSQRHPLEDHEYHKKSNAELIGIAKDAHEAAEAMKGHSTRAENKYRDQANDSATVRYFRQKSGMPDWYKKKYGHMKEETDTSEKEEMIQAQLHFIKYACKEILEYIEMGGEVEEWYQVKVAKSFSEFESLHSFIEGEARRTGMKEESVMEGRKLYKHEGSLEKWTKEAKDAGHEVVHHKGRTDPNSTHHAINKEGKVVGKFFNATYVNNKRGFLHKEEFELDEAAKWRSTSVAKKVTDPDDDSSHSYDYHHDNPKSTGLKQATSDKPYSWGSLMTRPKTQVASQGARKGMITKQHAVRLKDRIKSAMRKEEVELEEAEKMKGDDPCWKNYEMIGMKNKNGKKVPNCVPEVKEETDPPFDPDPRKKKDVIPGKHGEGYSKVRHLARQAMRKQIEKMKPVKESLDESRRAEIVKEIMNKKKKSNKDDSETFQKEPILSSEIVKA